MRKTTKKNYRMIGLLGIIIFTAIIVCTVGFAVSANSDRTSTASQSYYQSVRINSGDTLWSIAEEYCPTAVDMHDYIDDIKSMNNIKNNTIKAGEYLIIQVYR